MKIVKPVYVNHDNIKENHKDIILSSIYSIDFHPNGKKFTTGGGSDKYGIIKIWNMEPIRSNEKELDDNCPKILFEDYSHLKCVNAIKWSPNGKYLASGSIDTIIIIWVQKKLNDLERKAKKFSESYRGAYQLRGHTQDVMDLSWSPQGTYLCSGSVDSKIIVWNAEKFPEKAAILSGHTSFIKGVCWDPLGRYLASQSEDKSLRIWRTSDWKQEVKLQDEIDKSHSRCSFNRLTWSPDGSNVVATCTKNSGVPTAQLYNRDNWLKGVDMIGHRQHVICVKYFPRLLRCKDTQQEYLLLALGSKDRSLSIWTTLRRRPLAVINDLFDMTIIDLSWFVDKFELLACSLDGSIAYLQFNEKELGTPFTIDEMTKYFEKTYGNGFISETISMSKNKSFILPESCAVLELQRKQRELLHEKGVSGISTVNIEKQTGPKEQIVQRTQTGKRRITPKFISSIEDEDMDPDPVPIKKLSESPSSTDIDCCQQKDEEALAADRAKLVSKQKLLEEKFVKPESPTVQSKLSNSVDSSVNGSVSSVNSSSSICNGTSTSVSTTNGSGSSSTNVIIDDRKDLSNGKSKTTKVLEDNNKSPRKDETTANKSLSSIDNKVPRKEDKVTEPDIKTNDNKVPRRIQLYKDTVEKLNTDNIKPLDTSTLISLNVSNTEESPKKSSREAKTCTAEKRHQLVQPTIKSGSFVMCTNPGDSSQYMIKTVNDSTTDCKICKVCVSIGEQKLWDVTLSSTVAIVAHFRDKIFIGDVAGYLHAFYLKGGRLLAPLILDSGVVNIGCDGNYLFAVTSKATLFVWTLSPLSLFIKESFLFLLTDDGDKCSVNDVKINDDGNVSVVFDKGSSYIFNKSIGVWHEVYNNSNKFESWSISRLVNKNNNSLPLASMQKSTSPTDESHKGLSAAAKTDLRIDRLEIQMKLAQTLKSAEEYKYWLIILMRSLIDANKEYRVREICQGLLGPINTSSRSNWEPYIHGFSKRELLKEILPLLPLNLRLQHLYTEFSDQLDMLSKS